MPYNDLSSMDTIEKLGDCGLDINSGITNLSESIRNFKSLLLVCKDVNWIRGSITIPQSIVSVNDGFQISYVYGSTVYYTAIIFDSDTRIHADNGSGTHAIGVISVYGINRIE